MRAGEDPRRQSCARFLASRRARSRVADHMRRRGPTFRPLHYCLGLWLISSACEAPEVQESPANDDAPPSLERRERRSTAPAPKPTEVRYTILRGGTLRNVANLYKLHHHEIFALNPGIDPEEDLLPDTEVVVYRDLREPSESVGLPHDGRVLGAVPLPDGEGRKITAERWKTWATRSTVEQLDRVLKRWDELMPQGPPVLVGNLSARRGGPLAPHKTHQSGRDVDLSYIARREGKEPVIWQHMNARNLDASATWKLLKLLTQEARVETIFIDRNLQRALLAHARQHNTIRASRLGKWLEVADGGSERSLIRHVPGHADHIHVRFACPKAETRCRS